MKLTRGLAGTWSSRAWKASIFFVFVAGLLAVFVVFVILYMAGVNQWVCIGFGVTAATLLVWLTFRLNAKYGTHGLMKAAARKRHPRYVLNRTENSPIIYQKQERMRNVMKAATLESKFPLLAVENGCIISKDADITVCYRVELPELFTVTQAEYEAIHSAWAKAVKVLPNYSIVHKQDSS